MNLGMGPDEIAEKITLPKHLGDSPFLKEFYGSPEWSARNVFSGYLGWFDGNPSTLKPLPRMDEANNIIGLAGGWEKLFSIAEESFKKKQYQWALQLTDYLMLTKPNNKETNILRQSCLQALGERESNPNSRYFFLSSAALLDENYKQNDLLAPTQESINKYPIEAMLEILKVSVVPEKSIEKDIQLLFHFTDTGKKFSLFLRKGVLEIQPFELDVSSVQVITNEKNMKAVLTGLKSLPISLVTGSIKVNGSKSDLLSFFSSVRS